jgi:hypothetical protein
MKNILSGVVCFIAFATVFSPAHAASFMGIPIDGPSSQGGAGADLSAVEDTSDVGNPAAFENTAEPDPEPSKPASRTAATTASPSTAAADTAAGPRVLILFDVSKSVVKKSQETRMPLSKIREEALKLLVDLPATASVGIIQFAQNYKPYSDQLVTLTPKNRASIQQWLKTEWVGNGVFAPSSTVRNNERALVGVLEQAAKMEPDVVYLISDGSFQWRIGVGNTSIPWGTISTSVAGIKHGSNPAVLNFIGFQMAPADKAAMTRIVKNSRGQLVPIEKN